VVDVALDGRLAATPSTGMRRFVRTARAPDRRAAARVVADRRDGDLEDLGIMAL
jgi:hypothetical protein